MTYPLKNGIPSVPQFSGTEVLFGIGAQPLMTAAGRGVVGGVPYGEALQGFRHVQAREWMFRPDGGRRLAAATRSALGR